MTKVELSYDLSEPLNDHHLEQIRRLHGVYGVTHVRLKPDLKSITVEYDASRLSEFEVEDVLARAGLPISKHA